MTDAARSRRPAPTGVAVAPEAEPPNWRMDRVNGRYCLTLTGDWRAEGSAIPAFPASAVANRPAGATMLFRTVGVGLWDTGLVAFLWDAKREAATAGVVFDATALPEAARKLLDLLPDRLAESLPAARLHFRPLNWIGGQTVDFLGELGALSALLATTVTGAARAALGRARMRTVDLSANIRDAGPSALIIVSVVNFLLGAILAFVGAVQLRKFAADMYVANLVGLALVREMAAVMAGRTGGAYAARIATMQGNEEIDALTVIGIPVSDYIVLPAVLALVFTMPFLYLYGCVVGMFGGFVVSIAMLHITGPGYLNQTFGAVAFSQFAFGFTKSIAFALLIGVTSCRIGLMAGRSAADVGVAATRAVVVGIVGVIAMDAIFAVVADVLGV